MIMAAVTLKEKHRSDTIIGVLWAVGMALGVILLDLKPGYNVDLMSYLFGSILTVPSSSLWQMLSIGIGIVLAAGYFHQDFIAMSYDEEFARLRGVPVTFLYFLLIGMTALSIVIIIRVVGLILVIALLTIPPFIAEKYSNSLTQMMIISSMFSAAFSMIGLWLSYTLNLTSGATIILVAAAGFMISLLVEQITRSYGTHRVKEAP
jgi:zinc transport system permease protein